MAVKPFGIILAACAASILGVLAAGNPVRAAESTVESIVLSPATQRLDRLPANTAKQGEFTVLNDGQHGYDFIVYSAPYWVKDIFYTPDFMADRPNADAHKWVSFSQTKWRVEPRQTVTVPYTITVPGNASPGGHYGVVFAEVQPSGAPGEAVARKKRVGMILYANVEGKVDIAGKTDSIEIGWFQNHAPLKATIDVSNSGNIDFEAKQSLTVADVFGRVVAKSEQEVVVLPDQPRRSVLEWKAAPWLGLFKVTVSSTTPDETTTKESYVLVAPVWFVVVVFVLVGAGVFYALRRKRA